MSIHTCTHIHEHSWHYSIMNDNPLNYIYFWIWQVLPVRRCTLQTCQRPDRYKPTTLCFNALLTTLQTCVSVCLLVYVFACSCACMPIVWCIWIFIELDASSAWMVLRTMLQICCLFIYSFIVRHICSGIYVYTHAHTHMNKRTHRRTDTQTHKFAMLLATRWSKV